MKDIAERNMVFTLATENVLTLKEAANLLGLSYRQAQRIYENFLESGRSIESLKFKRSHPAWNKLAPLVYKKVVEFKEIYPNMSNYHLADILADEINRTIHPSTVRRILIQAGKYVPNPKQSRRGRKRFEKEQAGELVQMDTSQHHWLQTVEKPTYLVVLMDDYSRAIMAARIFFEDTTWNNMCVIKEAIEKYGIFKVLYTDNDSMFKYIRRYTSRHFEYKTDLEKVQTQIHRALQELDITLIHHEPYQPQSKGKIEKLFGFIQNRFVSESKDCSDLKELNLALQKWIKWYNTSHKHSITGVTPQSRLKNNILKPIPSGISLDDVFCIKEARIVKNDNTFEFQGRNYQITNFTHRISWAKAMIELYIIPDKSFKVFYNGQFIQQFNKK
jgi:transposase InsO family protein